MDRSPANRRVREHAMPPKATSESRSAGRRRPGLAGDSWSGPAPGISAVKPVTMLSARWRTATSATTRPIAAPPTRASRIPINALSLAQAPTTAAKAPISIMPSSPTAKTPARSDRMPPSAANSNGVAMRMAAARKVDHARRTVAARMNSIVTPFDHDDESGGNPDLPLHGKRARFEQADEERRRRHGHRLRKRRAAPRSPP